MPDFKKPKTITPRPGAVDAHGGGYSRAELDYLKYLRMKTQEATDKQANKNKSKVKRRKKLTREQKNRWMLKQRLGTEGYGPATEYGWGDKDATPELGRLGSQRREWYEDKGSLPPVDKNAKGGSVNKKARGGSVQRKPYANGVRAAQF